MTSLASSGWMPFVGSLGSVDKLGRRIAELNRSAEQAGHEPIPVTVVVTTDLPRDNTAEMLDRLADLAADSVIFNLPTMPTGQTLRFLDEYAGTAADHLIRFPTK